MLAARLATWVGNFSRNNVRAGPCGDLPGTLSAVTVPGKRAAARSGWAGASCGRELGAQPGCDREPSGRPAALGAGWDLQEVKWLLFLLRALVTFEDRRPQAGAQRRAVTGFALRSGGSWRRRAGACGMRWPGPGDPNAGSGFRKRPREQRFSAELGSHCLMSCD